MLVFLIGMPGSGKTTLASALAQELGFSFIDLDARIEKTEQSSISTVFRQKGEYYFREAEAKALRALEGKRNTVIATGGGTPCFKNNMAWMNQKGLTVFLDVPVEILAIRLEDQTNRPLLAGKTQPLQQKLHETLLARKRYYEQAAVKVAAGATEPTELAQLVRKTLEQGFT